MALDLNEYIKMSYERPNRKVLEGLGASEDLIEYLMETPGNTNLNVVDSITNPGGGGAEVWLVGNEYTDEEGVRAFILSNVGDVNHIVELYDNGDDYVIYLNDNELTFLIEPGSAAIAWADADDISNATMYILIQLSSSTEGVGTFESYAVYIDASTAPTSVEVSVKAK